MKFFISVVFFCLAFSMLAQTPKGLKYDQLIYSHDSLTAIVIKGKTTGVYNFQKSAFSVSPSKNTFFNFPQTNAYAEFSAKDGTISMHWISLSDYLFAKGSDSSCYIGFLEQGSGNLVSLNGRFFDKLNGDIAHSSQDEEKFETLVKIEKLNHGHFLITNYQAGYINTSIDTYIPGFNLSGIYDFNHNEYVIEPIYKHCYTVNQFVFCLKETQIYEDVIQAGLPAFNYTYDIYALRKDTALYDFYYEDVTELDQSKMEEVLAVGFSMTYSEDGKHCIYPFDNKYGFAKFQLFDDAEAKIPHFVFQNILPPIYDFIAFSNEFQKVITLKDYRSQQLELHHIFYGDHQDSLQYLCSSRTSLEYFDREPASLDDNFLVSPDSINSLELDSSGFFRLKESDLAKPLSFPNFGITILDDSLLIIHNYRDEILADFPYVTSNGDDSVAYRWDGSPYFVYPIEADYFGHSGVYDLKAGEWRISPAVVTISGGKSGFIYRHPVRIDNDLTKVFFSYAISRGAESGNWRFIDETTFENDPMLYRFGYSGLNADTVFEAPNGFYHHQEYQDENSRIYYMLGDKKMGIYAPGKDFWNNAMDRTFEFVHYNPTLDVYFYLEGDSIYYSSPFGRAAVSKRSGKIIFEQPDNYSDPIYTFQLTLIEGKDTTVSGESMQEFRTSTICSIEMKGDYLIVNDRTGFVYIDRNEVFINEGELITDKIIFESENSSVWKKNMHGTWVKISPYYASIEKIPNDMFIANSGYYIYEIDSYSGPSDPKGKTIDARYFILDSNLRVKSYMDYFDFAYIEDLGFGLKVQLNKGDKFFFMTYDLVAVTDAEWDRFELENGKLRAIIDTQYEIDPETGELIYNEYGAPNELVSSTTKYFKLP